MIEHIHSDDLNELDCDLLVNTTSAGMQEQESPFDLNHANRIGHVADIIYIDDVGDMPDSVGMVEVERGFLLLHAGTGRVDQQVAIQFV